MKPLLAAAAAALLATGALATPAGAAPVRPSADPFYAYAGEVAAAAPGTVLRTRQVALSVAGAPAALPATQVLYRTQDQLGQPSATVATIVRPALGAGPVKLLSYQTFYDGVADTCRPSYTLQGGDPNNTTAAADGAFMYDYLAQGFTVVTSDYEGPTDDYGAGRESAYGTLDAIRAAQHVLQLDPKSSPVGLVGYSGGSIASEWASELQPAYAPELRINGIAEGGIPVHYPHVLNYINGSADWAGAIPAVSIGLARAYRLDFPRFLNARGAQIVEEVSKGCLNPSAYPGLKLEDMLKPEYRDWKRVPEFVQIFNDGIMGSGTPNAPLFMAVGNKDGTGDGVMVAADVRQLAYTYCRRGLPVQLHQYDGQDHVGAAIRFEPEAAAFLQQRYAGQPPASDCASVGPGSALDPLPAPSAGGGSQAQGRPSRARARRRPSLIRLSGLRHRHGRYSVLVRATALPLSGVRLRVYRQTSRSRRSLVWTVALRGRVGPRGRRVRLPLHASGPTRRYLVLADGLAGTAPARASMRVRA